LCLARAFRARRRCDVPVPDASAVSKYVNIPHGSRRAGFDDPSRFFFFFFFPVPCKACRSSVRADAAGHGFVRHAC